MKSLATAVAAFALLFGNVDAIHGAKHQSFFAELKANRDDYCKMKFQCRPQTTIYGWFKAFVTFPLNSYRIKIGEEPILYKDGDILHLGNFPYGAKRDQVLADIISKDIKEPRSKKRKAMEADK